MIFQKSFLTLTFTLFSFLPLISQSEGLSPWGNMSPKKIYLEAPSASLSYFPRPSYRPVWKFPESQSEEIKAFLLTILRPEEVKYLENSEVGIQQLEGEVRVYPTVSFIRQLSREKKRKIYQKLAQYRANPFHYQPVFLHADTVEEWFGNNRLPASSIALLKELAYPIGSSLAFSDVSAFLSISGSVAQEESYWKALSRNYSMIIELAVDEGTDLEALKNYWTIDGRLESATIIFETFTRDGGETTFDINQMLPSIPRKYYNSFPTLRSGAAGTFPNGFWTSLNFFSFLPDPAFSDWTEVIPYLKKRYSPAEEPYRYGDLILFRSPSMDRPVHACVYLADDLVFTKNGISILEPWVIMHLPHVIDRFSVRELPEVQVWRRNPPSQQ